VSGEKLIKTKRKDMHPSLRAVEYFLVEGYLQFESLFMLN